jgi:hypothetical protein
MSAITRALLRSFGAGVRLIDSILRLFYGIETFSEDPVCLLRVSRGRSRSDLTLSDGWRIRANDPVLDIHLWNERLITLLAQTSGMGLATRLLADFQSSLSLLAADQHRESSPFAGLPLRAEFGFMTDLRAAKITLHRLGFDVLLKERPRMRFWHRAFWDNVYSYMLALAFNPDHMRGKRLADLLRIQIWMSPERLGKNYLEQGG